MSLESATTIAQLVGTNPLGTDDKSTADDHLRLIKNVLKQAFPGVAGQGFAIPITATEAELNYVSGVLSNIQAQLNAITASITTKAAKGANTDITSLASPAIGSATATTQATGNNTTFVATTAFVKTADDAILSQAIAAAAVSFANFQHNTPATTDGGAAVVGANIRNINATIYNNITGCSLTNKEITLPAGKFRISAQAHSLGVSGSKMVFTRVSDGAKLLIGNTSATAAGGGDDIQLTMDGVITTTNSAAYNITQWCGAAKTVDGMGKAGTTGSGAVEVYCNVFIEKIG